MSDRYDDPAGAGSSGASWGGGADRAEHGSDGPSGFLRGVGVVVVAAVIGVLLLPSATRAPLDVTTASQSTPTSTSPPTTAAPPRSTTTTLATIVPGAATIRVLVANGTGIKNLAGGTSTYLRSRGFLTLAATNATTQVTSTRVYAVSGPAVSATTVVEALGLASSAIEPTGAPVPVPSTSGATVVVVAGPDLARLAPSGSTTSSTGATIG